MGTMWVCVLLLLYRNQCQTTIFSILVLTTYDVGVVVSLPLSPSFSNRRSSFTPVQPTFIFIIFNLSFSAEAISYPLGRNEQYFNKCTHSLLNVPKLFSSQQTLLFASRQFLSLPLSLSVHLTHMSIRISLSLVHTHSPTRKLLFCHECK